MIILERSRSATNLKKRLAPKSRFEKAEHKKRFAIKELEVCGRHAERLDDRKVVERAERCARNECAADRAESASVQTHRGGHGGGGGRRALLGAAPRSPAAPDARAAAARRRVLVVVALVGRVARRLGVALLEACERRIRIRGCRFGREVVGDSALRQRAHQI